MLIFLATLMFNSPALKATVAEGASVQSAGTKVNTAIAAPSPAAAVTEVERKEALPKELEGVGISEHVGAVVPKDLAFVDHKGQNVTLGTYLDQGKPLILTLNYSNCPMLCNLQLTGFVDTLKKMNLSAGKDFNIVTVSLDPTENSERAHKTHSMYLGRYGRPEADSAWNFLVGSEANIRAVADSVGFGFRYNEERKEYMHTPALMILGPDGKVSRYLYGIVYEPNTLRFSLVEAAHGKTRSTLDQLILFCFHYDATKGRYAPVAENIMKAGGAVTLAILGFFMAFLWRRDVKGARSIG